MILGKDGNPFTEKFRPNDWGDLIYKDKWKLKKSLELGRVSHLLLYSKVGGLGKGSIVNIIKNKYGDTFKEVDCTRPEVGKEYLSNLIYEFASTRPLFSQYKKILFLDEVNKISAEAFETFKIPLEKYSHNFMLIIATNSLEKFPQPVLSRFKVIELTKPSENEILDWLKIICKKENIKYKEEILRDIIKTNISIRDMIKYIDDNQDYLYDDYNEIALDDSSVKPNKSNNEAIWRRYIKKNKIIDILGYCKKRNLNYYQVVLEISKMKISNLDKNDNGNKVNNIQRLIVDYKNKMENNQNSDILMEEFLYKFDKILSKK